MLYEPWPVDDQGQYRAPDAKEAESTFCASGEAVAETLEYFESLGGDTERLVSLLNAHVPDPRFDVIRATLFDPGRRYADEYYFYFINFTKKVTGRYNFHFGEGSDERLSEHHWIYEKGFMEHAPWGTDSDGHIHHDVTMMNLSVLYIFLESVDGDIARFFLTLMSIVLPMGPEIDSKVIRDENRWCSLEFVEYGFAIFNAIVADRKMLGIATYDSGLHKLRLARIAGLVTMMEFPRLFDTIVARANNVHKCVRESFQDGSLSIRIKRFDEFDGRRYCGYEESCFLFDIEVWASGIAAMVSTVFNVAGPPSWTIERHDLHDRPEVCINFFWEKVWDHKNNPVIFPILLTFCGIFAGYNLGRFWGAACFGIGTALSFQLIQKRRSIKRLLNSIAQQSDAAFDQMKTLEQTTEELLKERDLLEKKVRDRTAELAQANEKLKALDLAKTNFFYNISHELRTPLTLIKAPLAGLRSGRFGYKIAIDDPIFDAMARNCDRLHRQVNNLLLFAKIEQVKLRAVPTLVDLGKLLRIYAAELESVATTRGIELRSSMPERPCPAFVDLELFEVAFFNLASNALKFTDSGGRVEIECRAEGGEALVAIRDTGVGIAKERLEGIFERFGQSDEGANRRFEGTGIGLSLTKEIVGLMGGSIGVESELKQGSRFTLRLPGRVVADAASGTASSAAAAAPGALARLADATAAERRKTLLADVPAASALTAASMADRQSSATRNGRKKTVLLVEDNADLLEFLRGIFAEKFLTQCARDGAEALELLAKDRRISIVVSDIMMPGMDGKELLRSMRADERFAGLPFIFLTARFRGGDGRELGPRRGRLPRKAFQRRGASR